MLALGAEADFGHVLSMLALAALTQRWRWRRAEPTAAAVAAAVTGVIVAVCA
jgi:hypothetical protein